ncbi:MAG: dicarboxylate/amino acid:cation symporter [Muribaculaceae bacterium]|nr:dicarboxylate/amino acid:cation symporter [Muribaculaceae bacterium]
MNSENRPKRFRMGLLPRVLIAIVLGIALGTWLPAWAVRVFVTFNSIFSSFLGFLIPLIIVGLVIPAIAQIGRKAGRLLLLTVLIAYGDTVLSGLLSLMTSWAVFPALITAGSAASIDSAITLEPYFSISTPPMFDVMSALILAFILGLGMAFFDTPTLKRAADEFKEIISRTIEVALIPFLPVYILGIFASMAHTGQAWHIVQVFLSIIAVIFAMHIGLLVLQFCIAGAIARRNPFKSLITMLPAYFTALGTSSSAATIPVTLKRTKLNRVAPSVADFVIPLCATIHLSGSTMKITACAVALMLMQNISVEPATMVGFVFMLGIMMVAAPGVPGGAIMAALGVLQSFLGFDAEQQALMIALYIAMDSFGTACNVTGDGAIAMVVNRFARNRIRKIQAKGSGASAQRK